MQDMAISGTSDPQIIVLEGVITKGPLSISASCPQISLGAAQCMYVTIQYNTIQYNTIRYNTIQYNTIQYNTTRHDTTRHDTIQYNTIQYNTIQYNGNSE
jgi:hypothetical protein